jgi:uncharacterized protein involved in exopolysaccharide biosynthesis
MQDQSFSHIQIRKFFYLIKKHGWKILTLFLLTIITVAIGTLLAMPTYQASSQLLVKPGREDIYVSPTGSSPTVMDYSTGQGEKVNTEIAILRSRNLAINVVDRIGVRALFNYPDQTLKERLFKLLDNIGVLHPFGRLDQTVNERLSKGTHKRNIPPIEQVHRSVIKNLEVSNVSNSNVIKVTFEWPNPVIAAHVVNTLLELYLVQHLKVHTNPQTYNLLDEQTQKWQKQLRMSEKELDDFKHHRSITSLPQQRTILLGKLSESESQSEKTESEIQETLELVESLETQLSNLDQNIQLQETVNKSSETLTALKARLVDLELRGLKEEIKKVKEMIAEEEKKENKVVVSGRSPIRQNLQSEALKAKSRLEALKARQRNQKAQIATYEEQLKTLDSFEKRIKELERKVEIDEKNYKLYLTKFEESKISVSMDEQKIANVSIIEPAVPIMKPIKPKKKLNILVGGFLGLFFGIGMALFIEFLHPVFQSREDIEQYLGLPVLATLPKKKKINE